MSTGTMDTGGPAALHPDDLGEPKARKACINCRKQKMKCRIDKGDVCRRCHRAGVPCIFVPRANAAGLPGSIALVDRSQAELNREILRRLQALEEQAGFSPSVASAETPVLARPFLHRNAHPKVVSHGPEDDEHDEDGDAPPESEELATIYAGVESLRRCCRGPLDPAIWRRSTIRYLCETFHDRMPGLHFLPDRRRFSSPNPLLLASMLFCSSFRGDSSMAALSPYYFSVLCDAISNLSLPESALGEPSAGADAYVAEQWAFQAVLGIILAGLLTEASRRETGIWISVAYRLILEYCPAPHVLGGKSSDWRSLFCGIQIVDLEHASIHMSCPVIPIDAPLSSLQMSHRDQLYRLSRMMHTGLTHFTGRGLPTIWSCFAGTSSSSRAPPVPPSSESNNWTSTFTAVDAAVIRDWARQLDQWLVDFSSGEDQNASSDHDRVLVFRQYILHRLTVLSIYHPARGCNLYANGVTPKEQYELLLSARATLKLHANDGSIWSNWDLVMITWAALIVIQGIEGGAGEPDDLRDIEIHLQMLRQTNEPKPSLRDKLITTLEQSLQGVQMPPPPPSAYSQPIGLQQPAAANLDYTWQIFDRASLQSLNFPWQDSPNILPPP